MNRRRQALRRMVQVVVLLAAGALAYLLAWPVPIEPVAWQAPVFAGYAGPHARNERLAEITRISVAPSVGPEHLEFGPDGRLYTGVLSGEVVRMNADGTDMETVVDTGGRPLGLAFDAEGRLVIADALEGLLRVDATGRIELLADRVGNDPIRYADALAITADGRIIFTDASRRFSPEVHGTFDAALLDVLEHSCTGRVLEYDPVRRDTRIVVHGLCFPNGVALSRDQRHLFVAETAAYRIWKVEVAARAVDARDAEAGADPRARVILANLPGFPDNLTRGAEGRLWTGFTKPRSAAIDGMAMRPFLRAMTLRLPRSMWPVPPAYGHVIAFDEDGRVDVDLQDSAGRIPETSGATERNGRLYVQSLHADAYGVIELPPDIR